MLDGLRTWAREQGPLGVARLLLLDGPMFAVRVWLRLYLYVLAIGSLIVWTVLLIWLAQVVWRSLT